MNPFFQLMSSQVQKQLEVMMRSSLSVSVLLDHDSTSRVESPGVHIAEGCRVTASCNPFFYPPSHNTHTQTDTMTKSFCISFQNFLLVSCLSFLLLFSLFLSCQCCDAASLIAMHCLVSFINAGCQSCTTDEQ